MSNKIRILYIDDYELDRELVKDVLEKEHGGFQVTEASNKQEFEALLKTHTFDVVLSDFNIAGFEGLQVLEAVRAHDPSIPVIIVTGTGSEEIAVMALKQGASDYVIKRPKHIQRLPQTISAAMEKKALRDQSQKDETNLKQSEERYRTILENVLMGVYQVTVEGKFLFSNEKLIEMLGYASYEELEAIDNISELYVRAEERNDLVEDVIHKEFFVGEFEFRRKDGQSIWVKLHVRKTKSKEGAIILEGLMEDVTQIRKMEAQLQQSQKLEAIGTLSGGIAHDFNNILSSIIGFTELSLDEVEHGTTLQNNLTEVLKAGNRARDLIKQIMTFSRKSAQERKPVQINLLIIETVRMLRSAIPTNIEIEEHITPEMLTIDANHTQMNKVMVNLVTNASHAIDENGIIEIGLEVVSLDESIKNSYPDLLPGRYAKIFVSDNGCGIAEENLDLIFDPYFTTKDPDRGTGLGLAGVHGIVKTHGGHISVYSEVGKGTSFNVYFPIVDKTEKLQKTAEYPIPTGNERILLVDDEQVILDLGEKTLKQLGYDVVVKNGGVEALTLFRADPDRFDLVITDMTMPKMTGDQLARELMKVRPNIPVILCTGFSSKISREQAKEIGIKAYAMKPLARREMAITVRNVLDGEPSGSNSID